MYRLITACAVRRSNIRRPAMISPPGTTPLRIKPRKESGVTRKTRASAAVETILFFPIFSSCCGPDATYTAIGSSFARNLMVLGAISNRGNSRPPLYEGSTTPFGGQNPRIYHDHRLTDFAKPGSGAALPGRLAAFRLRQLRPSALVPSMIGGVCATSRDAKSGKGSHCPHPMPFCLHFPGSKARENATALYYIGSLSVPPTSCGEFAGESGNV